MTSRYDLHLHTDTSPCSRMAPEDLVSAAVEAGLDGIAITDHDTLEGARRVEAVAPDSLEVIPGAEVTTTQGHLLALGIQSTPPKHSDPVDAIRAVHDQDGVAILAHPFDTFRQTYSSDLPEIASLVDAVEVRNSRCLRRAFNDRAAEFAAEHGIPTTGGSDGHFPMEVGRAHTRFADEADPLEEIRRGAVEAAGRGRYTSGHVATKLHQFARRVQGN